MSGVNKARDRKRRNVARRERANARHRHLANVFGVDCAPHESLDSALVRAGYNKPGTPLHKFRAARQG